MVGEIRDPETAQIAIQSALTGHLVFTTVHANNVVDVLGRFLNMGVEPYQFVSALNCVMAQRLVRLICAHCKRPARVEPRAARGVRRSIPALARTHRFYEGAGCIECGGTGFKGRTAICELLDLSDRIREMILDRRPTSEIKKAAHEEGMRFLRESAVEKVLHGHDHAARDQQGDVRRMSCSLPGSPAPPPDAAVEIAPDARVGRACSGTRGADADGAGLRLRAAAAGRGRARRSSATTSSIGAAVVARAAHGVSSAAGSRPRRVALVIPDVAARVSLVRFDQVPSRRDDLDQLIRWQVQEVARRFRSRRRRSRTRAGVARRPTAAASSSSSLARRDVVARVRERLRRARGSTPASSTCRRFSVVNCYPGRRAACRPATGWWCTCGRTTPRSPSCAAAT